jgi:hypothetical protein
MSKIDKAFRAILRRATVEDLQVMLCALLILQMRHNK